MTVMKDYFVQCDICGDDTGSCHKWKTTAREAHEEASSMGWHARPSGRDVCKDCWQDGER